MKQRIYYCIETKVRELNARILFSILAAERGYSVVLGSRGHMLRFSKKLKKGLFLSNGNTKRLSGVSQVFKKLGFKVGHLDEEGAITFNYEQHVWRFDFDLFKKIDFFFAVGNREREAILSNRLEGNPDNKILITGNNRFDMLNKKFLNIYEDEIKSIKKKYGDFVLITTKFNRVNNVKRTDEDDFVKGSIKSGYIRREIDHYYASESIKEQKKTMHELEIFLKELNTNFPNKKFLLKPHPGENFKYWVEFKKKINQPNFEIIPVNEFHTNAFILASDFLIASNCTTLLESYLLNRLGFNFLPYENTKLHYELPKTLSENCYSKKELISKIKVILDKKAFEKKVLSEDEKKFLLFCINNIKENSVEKMLDYIDNLNLNDNSSDKFTVFSNLFFYRIKEKLIKILKRIFNKEDKYFKEKQEYLLQKNPGFTIEEMSNIKDKLCESLEYQKNKFEIKNIMPGLYSIEKKQN